MGLVENFFGEDLGEFKIKALSSHHRLKKRAIYEDVKERSGMKEAQVGTCAHKQTLGLASR